MPRIPALVSGLAPLAALLLLLAPHAEAGHLYVDPVNGSDANAGTSPGTAFKHIRKALQVANPGGDKIHLAPGEYSAASGELFPLSLGEGDLVGDAGSEVTLIKGAANELLFAATNPSPGGANLLELTGLSLIGGRTGLRVDNPAGIYQVWVQDVAIAGMSQDGIEAHAIPTGAAGSQVNLLVFRTTITGCLRAVTFQTSSPTLKSVLAIQSSRLQSNAVGLNAESSGDLLTTVISSRIEDNTLNGLRAFANGGKAQLEVEGSLVARNVVGVEAGGLGGGTTLLGVRACTVARNGVGVSTVGFPDPPASTVLEGSIVWENADDLALDGPVSAELNDVSDGDFAGGNGNLAVDPLFRDADAGDFRLSWGSPVVEVVTTRIPFELVGNQRPCDGNLDVAQVADMGCLEFTPLDMVQPELTVLTGGFPSIGPGETLRLEAWGPPGSVALLLVSPAKAVAISTGFGVFFLDPSFFFVLAALPAGPTRPGVLQVVIPNVAALNGLAPDFQALTTSALAPKGKALSNPALCQIEF